MYPSSIRNLIECLKDLPGIGEKTAERLAYAIVGFDKDKLDNFANSLISIKDNIKRCSICNCITDMDKCYICNDDNRINDTIFVVEKSKDIFLFEKMGMPVIKKTKTGYSTDSEVLETLAADYEFVNDILRYRQLTKLKSTYIDGLLNVINPGTNRVYSGKRADHCANASER